MIGFARRAWDGLVGRGSAAVTVPPMDGALRPNNRLERAAVVARLAMPDNLIRLGNRVVASSGRALLELDPVAGSRRPLHEFDQPVACTAVRGDGLLAVGLVDGGIFFGGNHDSPTSWRAAAQRVDCPTAMTFDARGDLIVCQGSAQHAPDRWKHDLMARGSSGAVWRIGADESSGRCVARGLAFPFGVAPHGDGFVVSESWRHRIVHIDEGGATTLLGDLPGYPARIVPSRDGYWLCVFAPRSQLVEFVLREAKFRERMMREVDDAHWVAPTLSSARSYLDPMQGGGMVTQGQIKPWAPTRSYGLVVRLDVALRPIDSFHSRADGHFHGVTSCVETDHGLLVASRGDGAILALPAVAATGHGAETAT